MATKIVTKNSSTASAVPTASDLVQGELAVNVADKRLFTEDNGGSIVELGTNPSTIDINAGSIDGTAIGASSASTGAFTTLTASGAFTSVGIDDNATSTAITIDSSENVSIGTSATSAPLRVNVGTDQNCAINTSGGNPRISAFNDAVTASVPLGFNGSILKFETGGSERMRIDASGRVLLNRTASTGSLTLESQAPSGFSIGSGFYSGSTQSTIEFKDSNTTANYKVRIGSQTDDMVMFAGGSERLRIDSSGNVGISQASPVYFGSGIPTLSLKGNASSQPTRAGAIVFDSQSGTGGGSWIYTDAGGMRFGTGTSTGIAASERMRIDSSGRLLVGQTSVSSGGASAGNATMYVNGGIVRKQASFSDFNEAWASGHGTIFEGKSGFNPSNKPNSEAWFHVKTIYTQTSGSNFYLTQTCTTLVGRIYTRYNSNNGSSSSWSSWVEK